MSHTKLSAAEEAGWRRYWDGWVICPRCIARMHQTVDTWRVPPTYDNPIEPPERCADCRADVPGPAAPTPGHDFAGEEAGR